MGLRIIIFSELILELKEFNRKEHKERKGIIRILHLSDLGELCGEIE